VEHLKLIEANLQGGYPDLFAHMLDQMVENLAPYFTDTVMTMFIASLQDSSPDIAKHIFDVFLLDGEKVIFTLLMKLIDLKQDTLLNMYDNELTEYFKTGLPLECFKEYAMPDLLDFTAMCDDIIE